MTVKLVVLYAQPDDPDAFDEHYLGIHGPLVHKVPGLQRFESARIVAPADRGEATYCRIAELYFADQAALQAGLGSEEGAATAADYQQIAPSGSRMFIATVDE
ncbi:MAG TPA: EthD family reductase [Mycobacteriales bacterium]|nr:EthD family reductase [Mycobacteriales bacterium]